MYLPYLGLHWTGSCNAEFSHRIDYPISTSFSLSFQGCYRHHLPFLPHFQPRVFSPNSLPGPASDRSHCSPRCYRPSPPLSVLFYPAIKPRNQDQDPWALDCGRLRPEYLTLREYLLPYKRGGQKKKGRGNSLIDNG